MVPLLVLDPDTWGPDLLLGRPRMGTHRARFLLESIGALREALRARGGELWVRVGDPVRLVPELAARFGCERVFWQRACAWDEVEQERAVKAALASAQIQSMASHGEPLLHPEDLPFPISELPDVFTSFRKAVERDWRVRDPLPAPERVSVPPADGVPAGDLPRLEDLGLTDAPQDPRAILRFEGGEAAGLERLRTWAFDADALASYKETRNGLLQADASSKLSPWLALGCLSPRRVVQLVRSYEAERGANESTYWLVFELLWRDYFKFLGLREGARLFRRDGVGRRHLRWSEDVGRWTAWAEGRTGYPFVDAFMRELVATGFMSNRGRQNVASFLAKTLNVDWRWGAAHFETHLIDYDPCSNWGNWQYVAGVGTDPRDRVFNAVKQGRDYDPDGAFVRRWLPELEGVPHASVHAPDVSGNGGYPAPIVAPESAFAVADRGRRRGRRRRR